MNRIFEDEAVETSRELLESCWMLVDQEALLDVAATMAATQSGPAEPAITNPLNRQALAMHWRAERKRAS
jgi:hypothetical protein